MTALANIPDIDWPKPVINNPRAAMDDISCRIERLKALFWSNTCDMQDALIDPQLGVDKRVTDAAYRIWMIYTSAGEKLEEIETLFVAVHEALLERGLDNPVSSVGKHTRIRRSQDWHSAVAALKATNSSGDSSDEALEAAGTAFEHMLETRVSSPAQLREKLMLISTTRHGMQDSDFDEVFRDFDALGWRAAQAEG